MNQEENSPSSQEVQSAENGLEPQQNQEEKGAQPQQHGRQPIIQEQAVQPVQKEFTDVEKNNEEKANEPELPPPPSNNSQIELKQKVKNSNDEVKNNEAPTKIRKKIKKSKSFSSFSEESFTSNKKQKKRKGRKPNDAKKAAQNSAKPEGKRRGRQKSVAPKLAVQNKESKAITEQFPKTNQKTVQKNTPVGKRTVVQANRNDIYLANMHWNNQKVGEVDFSSVDAQICQDSCNYRVNSQINRKIIEMIEVQGENIVKKIADLPILFY